MPVQQGSAKLAGSGGLTLVATPLTVPEGMPPRPYHPSIYNADPHPTSRRLVPITKSDTVPLPLQTCGLLVMGAGDVAVRGILDSVAVTLVGVPAGKLIEGRFGYVMATNTSATGIIAVVA